MTKKLFSIQGIYIQMVTFLWMWFGLRLWYTNYTKLINVKS